MTSPKHESDDEILARNLPSQEDVDEAATAARKIRDEVTPIA